MFLSCEEWLVVFSLVFPVIYTKGPPWVSFYTKFVTYYASLTFCASMTLPLTLLRPKDPRNLLWPNRLLKMTTALLGIQWKTVDPDRALQRLASSNGPAVVVINHQSSLDVLGVLCELFPLMDGQVTVVAKKSLLYTGPFGLMGYMSGMTFIDRRKNVEAKQSLHEAVELCKRNNWKMIGFPEPKVYQVFNLLFFKPLLHL